MSDRIELSYRSTVGSDKAEVVALGDTKELILAFVVMADRLKHLDIPEELLIRCCQYDPSDDVHVDEEVDLS